MDLVPRVTELLDEPMGDPSIFPTYLLKDRSLSSTSRSLLAATVNDEAFMGYRTYQALKAVWMIDESPLAPFVRWAPGELVSIGWSPAPRPCPSAGEVPLS